MHNTLSQQVPPVRLHPDRRRRHHAVCLACLADARSSTQTKTRTLTHSHTHTHCVGFQPYPSPLTLPSQAGDFTELVNTVKAGLAVPPPAPPQVAKPSMYERDRAAEAARELEEDNRALDLLQNFPDPASHGDPNSALRQQQQHDRRDIFTPAVHSPQQQQPQRDVFTPASGTGRRVNHAPGTNGGLDSDDSQTSLTDLQLMRESSGDLTSHQPASRAPSPWGVKAPSPWGMSHSSSAGGTGGVASSGGRGGMSRGTPHRSRRSRQSGKGSMSEGSDEEGRLWEGVRPLVLARGADAYVWIDILCCTQHPSLMVRAQRGEDGHRFCTIYQHQSMATAMTQARQPRYMRCNSHYTSS